MAHIAQMGFGKSELVDRGQSQWGKVTLGELAYYANQQTKETSLFAPAEGWFARQEHPRPDEFEQKWSELVTHVSGETLALITVPM